MSNIGYAVFGSPKGIAVLSNGLFKSLNLDKSLYLNNAHIALEKGEQILMIRRIPSDLNRLEQKDALLIALYENALQYGENRAGGFVGSAICFKDKMPNAEEMISGLVYLFSKMKENVDADNRFKSIDASNWNISLPDANKKFGLEDSKLNYAPISSTSNNIIIKLYSLEKESASLLYNFALNKSFHSVDYLYASMSNAVVEKMKPNGFIQLPFAELFNYNSYFNFLKDKLDKDNDKLRFINKNADDLQRKIANDSNDARSLDDKIVARKKDLERIDNDISVAENQLKEVLRKKTEVSRNTSFQKPPNISSNNNVSSEDKRNYDALKMTIAEASNKIRNYTNLKISETSDSTEIRNKAYVDQYFSGLKKRKRIALVIFSILIALVITFVSLYIFKFNELTEINERVTQQKEDNQVQRAKVDNETKKAKEFLNKLKRFERGSVTANHREFKKAADDLLKNYLDGKYKVGSDELIYIHEHKWQFWEFDYKNDQLVNKLNPNSKDTYFITLESELKPLKAQIKWKGEDNIDEQFENYIKETNDIYGNLDSEILKDLDLMKAHFKWVIYRNNGELKDLNLGNRIKLPFLK